MQPFYLKHLGSLTSSDYLHLFLHGEETTISVQRICRKNINVFSCDQSLKSTLEWGQVSASVITNHNKWSMHNANGL